MGFGILFIAYFLAFFVPLSYLEIIGYAGLAWALGKLRDYRPAFMKAVWWLIPLGACCLYHITGSVIVTAIARILAVREKNLPFFSSYKRAFAVSRIVFLWGKLMQ